MDNGVSRIETDFPSSSNEERKFVDVFKGNTCAFCNGVQRILGYLKLNSHLIRESLCKTF